MKIITDIGEYVLRYEDDKIIYADPPRVQVELHNLQGQKVILEVELFELKSMAELLCEHVKCGVCGKALWWHDDGKWNHQVGHICTPCTQTSDHPAAIQHREFESAVADLVERDRKGEGEA